MSYQLTTIYEQALEKKSFKNETDVQGEKAKTKTRAEMKACCIRINKVSNCLTVRDLFSLLCRGENLKSKLMVPCRTFGIVIVLLIDRRLLFLMKTTPFITWTGL